MSFHSALIQSRITEIDRVLDSVCPLSGTGNQNGIGQSHILERVCPNRRASRNQRLFDLRRRMETQRSFPTPPEPRLSNIEFRLLPTSAKTLQNCRRSPIPTMSQAENPQVLPSPASKVLTLLALAVQRLLPHPKSQQLLLRRNQDLIAILHLEYPGEQKFSALLGNIVDRSNLVFLVKRLRCQLRPKSYILIAQFPAPFRRIQVCR